MFICNDIKTVSLSLYTHSVLNIGSTRTPPQARLHGRDCQLPVVRPHVPVELERCTGRHSASLLPATATPARISNGQSQLPRLAWAAGCNLRNSSQTRFSSSESASKGTGRSPSSRLACKESQTNHQRANYAPADVPRERTGCTKSKHPTTSRDGAPLLRLVDGALSGSVPSKAWCLGPSRNFVNKSARFLAPAILVTFSSCALTFS